MIVNVSIYPFIFLLKNPRANFYLGKIARSCKLGRTLCKTPPNSRDTISISRMILLIRGDLYDGPFFGHLAQKPISYPLHSKRPSKYFD